MSKPYRYSKPAHTSAWNVYGPANDILQALQYEYQAIGLVNMLNDAYAAGAEAERSYDYVEQEIQTAEEIREFYRNESAPVPDGVVALNAYFVNYVFCLDEDETPTIFYRDPATDSVEVVHSWPKYWTMTLDEIVHFIDLHKRDVTASERD